MGAEVQPVLWVHNAVQAQAPTSSGPSGASMISVDREETSDDIFSPQAGGTDCSPREQVQKPAFPGFCFTMADLNKVSRRDITDSNWQWGWQGRVP